MKRTRIFEMSKGNNQLKIRIMIVKMKFRANIPLGTMSFIVSFDNCATVLDILSDPDYFRYCLVQLKTEMGIPGYYYFSGLEDLDHAESQIDEEDIIRNF